MKRLAVMQPYFFPYLGYFQLIHAADTFVIFDDVNFIKRGWVSRNQLLINGQLHTFTVPVRQASRNKPINNLKLADFNDWSKKFKKKLTHCYAKAPYFEETTRVIFPLMDRNYHTLTHLLTDTIVAICQHLNITTRIITTSTPYNNKSLRGQARIIDICQQENATQYINLPGGQNLYDDATFRKKGITLNFIKSNLDAIEFTGHTAPYTSIIHLLVTQGRSETKKALDLYTLEGSIA